MTTGNCNPDPGTSTPKGVVLAPGMISLDWLTVNMTAPTGKPFGLPWDHLDPVQWVDESHPYESAWRSYRTQPTDIRTSQFRRVTYVCDEKGEKVVTIGHDPHNANRNDPGWIQVQFHNATLYTGEWAGLFRMFRAIGCEYRSISRVDIACDGIEGDGGDFPAVVDMANRGEARYYGKCEWIQRSNRSKVIGAEFGSRSSNKFIRAYRKKREMKAKGVKPHIVKAWQLAFGFDVMAAPVEVNRFEVQLKGKEIRRYFPGENDAEWVLGLEGIGQRVDVFSSMATSLFDFRTVAVRSRDALRVCSWDYSRLDAKDSPVEREPRNLALSDHTIKTGLRNIYMLGHVMADRAAHDMALRYATAAGDSYVEWYERKRIEWTKEFGKIAAAGDPNTLRIFQALRDSADGLD